ncbi:MAG: hypothetical protein GX058_01260 [Firmicutes bacterium]|nr:hypothetical protein [Bacillota bacterium]
MPKRTDYPLQVACTRQGLPRKLIWPDGRRSENIAEILDYWREVGAWWDGESERQVYLVVTTTQKSYELYQVLATGSWYLTRVFD